MQTCVPTLASPYTNPCAGQLTGLRVLAALRAKNVHVVYCAGTEAYASSSEVNLKSDSSSHRLHSWHNCTMLELFTQ